ncbi:MAG: serine/threonine-protein kinase [Myxococcota bacterium]
MYEALFQVPPRPRQFGRYVVLNKLGSGGMGVVYEAFDRTLDRKVAIKVLRRTFNEKHTARLLREAQAMAKLSHPNVVQVFEAGMIGSRAFVAMELVQGPTLQQWIQRAPGPGWRQCVEVFVQVGQGLAAAHEQGLVHRDFKPSNAIIDEKGRPRVLDFGLVARVDTRSGDTRSGDSGSDDSGSGDSGSGDSGSGDSGAGNSGSSGGQLRSPMGGADRSALDLALTRTGGLLGTPAYMPPERMRRGKVDARGDQFSFCVALYEALYGERPFEGSTMSELMAVTLAGTVRPAPPGSVVPQSVRAVIVRGLATEPAERWPSMEALLEQLRAVVAPRTRRWLALSVGLGLGVGLVAVGVGLAVGQYVQVKDRCTGARAQLDGVWDDGRRQQVRAALLGTELSYAPGTWVRIEPRLDDYAQTWASRYTEVCEATRVRGEQTEAAMELRMGCMRDLSGALDAAVAVLADADDRAVRNAVTLVDAMPPVDRCDDLGRLQQRRQRVPPPEDPGKVEAVEGLRGQLARIEAELGAGRYADALEHAQPVVQRARALEYGPLLAEALVVRGLANERVDELAVAERDLEQAFTVAAEHGHYAVAVEAVGELVRVVGYRQERHESGLLWAKTAEALSRGPDIEPAAQARVLDKVGVVLLQQGKGSEALDHFQRALAIKEQALGPEHGSMVVTLSHIGIALHRQGKRAEARAHYQRALARQEHALGPDHPDVAVTLGHIANVLREQGEQSKALTVYRRVLAIKQNALGPEHSSVAATLGNIGLTLHRQGELSEARSYYQRGLRIFERTLGPEHSAVATVLLNLGSVRHSEGHHAEALVDYQRALAIQERAFGSEHAAVAVVLGNIGLVLHDQGRLGEALAYQQRALAIEERALGADHPDVAATLGNIGLVLRAQGQGPQAKAHLLRAMAIKEAALGPDHYSVAYPLIGLAKVALDQRDFEAARAHAERAVSIREAGEVAPDRLAEARFVLAAALWNDRTERERARALAEQARDALAAADGAGGPGGAALGLDQVEAWLATHRLR